MDKTLIKKEKDFFKLWQGELAKKNSKLIQDSSFQKTSKILIKHLLEASTAIISKLSQEEFFSMSNLIKYIITMQEHNYDIADVVDYLESLLDTTSSFFPEHISEESDSFKNILKHLITFMKKQNSQELLLKEKIQYLEKTNLNETLTMAGSSKTIKRILNEMKPVLDNNVTVLIEGESGTGKELLAKALYRNSTYNQGSFIALNCAALPEDLVESELFGYKKGAFTDAHKDSMGKFELANKGVLFLDEINELSPLIQSKLLRVLQERTIVRLGESTERPIDLKLICATNKNLKNLVADNKFREDLYYRINVYPIILPPLRERPDDIIPLANHFLQLRIQEFNKKIITIDPKATELMLRYNWPGNIRELDNVITRAVLKTKSNTIRIKNLDIYFDIQPTKPIYANNNMKTATAISLKDAEKKHIFSILKKNHRNIQQSAKDLGITRTTLYNKMKEYNLGSA